MTTTSTDEPIATSTDERKATPTDERETTPTDERIMDAAEAQARTGGYNSFSFRGISNEIGIKSSSIHYHFPTKADLAQAIAKRYTDRFIVELKRISDSDGSLKKKVDAYVELFRKSLLKDKKMCLCGLFAAEIDCIPQGAKVEIRNFFNKNLDWLEDLFRHHQIKAGDTLATQLLAALEGGMLLARSLDSDEVFTKASDLSHYGL